MVRARVGAERRELIVPTLRVVTVLLTLRVFF
jgi:hypothetical protein